MELSRREWLAGVTAAAAMPRAAYGASTIVTPEQFGAVGDGRTNDSAAFAALSAYVNRLGSGEIALRPTTYIVGRQMVRGRPDYAFAPTPILDFKGCTGPLVVRGNGAHLRSAAGLRFGTFDPASGAPTRHALPFYKPGESASPYFAMINVEDCSGPVEISGFELDGNAAALRIGGPWGDTGWQIGCAGLYLKNNRGPIIVSNIRSHHHVMDGGIGFGPGRPGQPESVTLRDCEFISNARNGFSMVGGVGWTFERCKFNRSGRDLPFRGSAPKAGIDFEAEGGKFVSHIRLLDCLAEDNVGVACLHPGSGRTSDVYWQGGRIVGTTASSYFGGGNAGIAFRDTLFLGMLVNLSKERFESCTFSDDPALSPTGALYHPSGFIIPDCRTANRFIGCTIVHARPGRSLNGNLDQALFEDCVFRSARGAGRLDVYGHFRGAATRFIAEPGGTDFVVTPGGEGGTTNAGAAEDSFSIMTAAGQARTYPPTTRDRRP